jgi:hypothetical protein
MFRFFFQVKLLYISSILKRTCDLSETLTNKSDIMVKNTCNILYKHVSLVYGSWGVDNLWRMLSSGMWRHLLTLVPHSRIFLPWRWRRYVPPKRRFTQDLHGGTCQKATFFIVTAMKTSNLTLITFFLGSNGT